MYLFYNILFLLLLNAELVKSLRILEVSIHSGISVDLLTVLKKLNQTIYVSSKIKSHYVSFHYLVLPFQFAHFSLLL